jgi:hypothetical protein
MELEKFPEKIYLPYKQLEKNPEPRSFHDLAWSIENNSRI